MTLALVFWILMLLWLVTLVWWHWPANGAAFEPGNGFLFILLLVLGWAVFGAPIR